MKKFFFFSLLTGMVLLFSNNSATAQCGFSQGFYYCSSYGAGTVSQTWSTSQTSYFFIYVNMIVDEPDGIAECSISFGNYYFSKAIDYDDNFFDDTFSGASTTSVSSLTLDTYAINAESHISAGW